MPSAKHDESDTSQVAKEEEEEKERSSGASVSSSQVLAID